MIDEAKAARRLSSAFGEHVTEDDVDYVFEDKVILKDGRHGTLRAQNAVYVGGGVYMRNGETLTEAEVARLYE
jgi:hypothetical protein